MAEKVEGMYKAFHDRRPNADGGAGVNGEHNPSKEKRTNPEDLVRDLESSLGKKKLPQQRNVLLLTGSPEPWERHGNDCQEPREKGF